MLGRSRTSLILEHGNSGPWVIDENQPIRLAKFNTRTQEYKAGDIRYKLF